MITIIAIETFGEDAVIDPSDIACIIQSQHGAQSSLICFKASDTRIHVPGTPKQVAEAMMKYLAAPAPEPEVPDGNPEL